MTATDFQADVSRIRRSSADQRLRRVLELFDRVAGDNLDAESAARVLAECCLTLPADLAVVWLADDGGTVPRLVSARHVTTEKLPGLLARLLQIPGEDVARLLPAVPPDDRERPHPVSVPAAVRRALAPGGEVEVLTCPVPRHDGTPGVVLAARIRPAAPFGPLDADLINLLARRCGAWLDTGRLLAQVRRQAEMVQAVSDAIIGIDRDGVVVSWNRAAERIYQIPVAEAVGAPLDELITNTVFEDGIDAATCRQQVLRTGAWRGRVRQTSRSGAGVSVESSVGVRRDESGGYTGMVAVNRDLTEVLAARASAQTQVRFTQDLMDALDSRAAVIETDGRVLAVNARWRHGLADRDRCVAGPVQVGESWTAALRATAEPELSVFAEDVDAVLRGERPLARVECRCVDAGPERATAIEVVRLPGDGAVAVVVQTDVSWRRRLEDELSYRATHDELTGLPNRAALMEELSSALRRLDGERQLAVLFCDLDGFKDVNDGLGHAVGDQVLVAVARRLRQRCRSADIVARFGGDEFVVVLTVPDAAQAQAMADRIVEVLAEPIVVGDAEVASGASVGITVVASPPDGEDPVGTLLRDADTAMYQAKERGRGRSEFFDAGLRRDIERRVELTAALRRASTAGELEVIYQTRRHCGDRSIAGVEALLQWRRGGRLVDPAVFVPIAERSGRIVEIGAWMMERALGEFAAAAPDLRQTLAVNVSPRQLTAPHLVGTVATVLAGSGLQPERLVLEITEGALVEDPDAARTVLNDLRALGVTIALDDFGTGWSALSYLRTLPVDVIKIDRSFVADLPTRPGRVRRGLRGAQPRARDGPGRGGRGRGARGPARPAAGHGVRRVPGLPGRATGLAGRAAGRRRPRRPPAPAAPRHRAVVAAVAIRRWLPQRDRRGLARMAACPQQHRASPTRSPCGWSCRPGATAVSELTHVIEASRRHGHRRST